MTTPTLDLTDPALRATLTEWLADRPADDDDIFPKFGNRVVPKTGAARVPTVAANAQSPDPLSQTETCTAGPSRLRDGSAPCPDPDLPPVP